MKTYKSFLNEESTKNLHMTHLEDLALDAGVDGVRGAIEFLSSLRDMLSGQTSTATNVTVKFDGAPAVFAGTNPENGQFFVGTKSVFNRGKPKINYTEADIDTNHSGELANKLKLALKELSGLGIKGILQGDMMFSNSDLKTDTIDGEKYITFQPNTIVYAVSPNTTEGKEISKAKMGIVFHTTYTGNTMEGLKASFGANISSLKKTSSVWVRDAYFKDVFGSATFTSKENDAVSKKITSLENLSKKISSSFLKEISRNQQINLMLNVHANSLIRNNKKISVAGRIVDFSKWLKERYQKEMDKLKTDKSKKKREDELNYLLKWVNKNRTNLKNLYEFQVDLVDVKTDIIRKLQKVKGIGTFVRTDTGFRVTAPEGFVAVRDGGAVKLVDRLEFSQQNFNAVKGWDK